MEKIQIKLRSAKNIMKLDRLGSFHQNRLSFVRSLLRRFARENWLFERPQFCINHKGEGFAIYTASGPNRIYSLIAFAHDLPDDKRSDRVIATEWDATFTLFDGIPTEQDIKRLEQNVPLQEGGRVTEKELTISRANKSVRFWEHVVEALSEGFQPDESMIDSVGYLMRTTAVYGSGKFGAADRKKIDNREEFKGSFQVEMLTVYLIRIFVVDLVEHMASQRSPKKAVSLDGRIKKRLGIGNSTGLGMAPFLINHPILLNNWISAKEEALRRVRSVEYASSKEKKLFNSLIPRVKLHLDSWQTEHKLQLTKIRALKTDLSKISKKFNSVNFLSSYPWDKLYKWAEAALSVEGQELLQSLIMEPYSSLVDGLTDCMYANEEITFCIEGQMRVGELISICKDIYDWALEIDWNNPKNFSRVWYVSEEKQEPRLGERLEENLGKYEKPLQPGRDVARLFVDLKKTKLDDTIASFLINKPEHRHIVRRCQIAAKFPYAEIYDNTIDAKMLPIDFLRAKLSFFGASHFDPRSDRWVRINMFKGAPFPYEINNYTADDWVYPFIEDI